MGFHHVQEDLMTTVASEGVPETRHQLQRRLRATVLGPRGGGTTRRRASDAFRLGFAVVVVTASIPVMRANSAIELSIVRALNPPPAAVSWLVTSVFWLGSAGVIALLVIIALLVPRFAAIGWTALAAVLTWGSCALLSVLLGSGAGRPPVAALAGLDASYPVTGLAVTIAVAATALPYLSRPVHRLASFLIGLAVLAAVCGGQALPVNAISSIALGWGVASALHLAVGSPLGLPSAAEITEWITDLNVAVRDLTRAPRQVWGVEQFTGRSPAGDAIELSVYGRDASDARMLAKVWRFCLYRDSGPTLVLDRLQQVEHEAYLTMMAGRAGLLVPDVLAAGRFGPSRDAALVTSLPDGPALAEADGADLADGTLDEILRATLGLRGTGIAHGALGGDTIIVSGQGVCIRDFRRASACAQVSRLDSDLAAALGAMAVRAGAERTAAAAARVLDADTARGALVHLQRSALDPVTVAALQHQKHLLPGLREAVASGAGIDLPKLAEVKRISWTNLLFAVGSLIGIWLIIGVLSGAGGAMAAIKGASWGWVALAFVFAQFSEVAEAWALLGAVAGQLPFGRCVALEISNTFSSLVGGDVAVFAIRVRFFQRQGYDTAAAVSSGAIASAASWIVKSLLFLVALPFAAGTFHGPSGSGGHQTAVWIILAVIAAAGIAAALISLVPRLRRLASQRIRPYLLSIWANIKAIATEPRKIVYVLAGSALAQLVIVFALGAALHAVGARASIATLITVNTLAAIVGGAVPVPGGAGVIEAGLIAGLTGAGVPQDQAVAAVLIQRLFTAYLPPVWGFLTLTWMRRREYV
ncbi:MAG TPA: lysylphosphatidylglycerol synthase transmembrane domain-containing protein [Streptosporangiaceae bacterium]|nr:lysylphosphatidylglycerol synthase transmembrane domain-containing protein [Streptosporangiaceae bacterium]